MTTLDKRSKDIRKTIVRMVEASRRGHIGSAFSLVEILRVLYDDVMKYNSKKPKWEDRDRFLLSKGHGCLALYAILAEKGFFSESELWNFCKPDGILGGHPEYEKVPGVEASTGSLGHGLAIGVGMALNAKLEKKKHRVFVVVSDGECHEGSLWEAALYASKHQLNNLNVFVDFNKHTSYGIAGQVLDLEPLADKWKSFGFSVAEIDGHSVDALRATCSKFPFEKNKPSIVICHTVKGKGVPFIENDMKWHHKNKITDDEVKQLMSALVS